MAQPARQACRPRPPQAWPQLQPPPQPRPPALLAAPTASPLHRLRPHPRRCRRRIPAQGCVPPHARWLPGQLRAHPPRRCCCRVHRPRPSPSRCRGPSMGWQALQGVGGARRPEGRATGRGAQPPGWVCPTDACTQAHTCLWVSACAGRVRYAQESISVCMALCMRRVYVCSCALVRTPVCVQMCEGCECLRAHVRVRVHACARARSSPCAPAPAFTSPAHASGSVCLR